MTYHYDQFCFFQRQHIHEAAEKNENGGGGGGGFDVGSFILQSPGGLHKPLNTHTYFAGPAHETEANGSGVEEEKGVYDNAAAVAEYTSAHQSDARYDIVAETPGMSQWSSVEGVYAVEEAPTTTSEKSDDKTDNTSMEDVSAEPTPVTVATKKTKSKKREKKIIQTSTQATLKRLQEITANEELITKASFANGASAAPAMEVEVEDAPRVAELERLQAENEMLRKMYADKCKQMKSQMSRLEAENRRLHLKIRNFGRQLKQAATPTTKKKQGGCLRSDGNLCVCMCLRTRDWRWDSRFLSISIYISAPHVV